MKVKKTRMIQVIVIALVLFYLMAQSVKADDPNDFPGDYPDDPGGGDPNPDDPIDPGDNPQIEDECSPNDYVSHECVECKPTVVDGQEVHLLNIDHSRCGECGECYDTNKDPRCGGNHDDPGCGVYYCRPNSNICTGLCQDCRRDGDSGPLECVGASDIICGDCGICRSGTCTPYDPKIPDAQCSECNCDETGCNLVPKEENTPVIEESDKPMDEWKCKVCDGFGGRKDRTWEDPNLDEICTNKIDDDCDLKVSCRDEDCDEQACENDTSRNPMKWCVNDDCKQQCAECIIEYDGETYEGFVFEGKCVEDKDSDGFIKDGEYDASDGAKRCLGDCDDDASDDWSDDDFSCKDVIKEDCGEAINSICAVCINPGMTEVCDGVDNTCDDNVDKYDYEGEEKYACRPSVYLEVDDGWLKKRHIASFISSAEIKEEKKSYQTITEDTGLNCSVLLNSPHIKTVEVKIGQNSKQADCNIFDGNRGLCDEVQSDGKWDRASKVKCEVDKMTSRQGDELVFDKDEAKSDELLVAQYVLYFIGVGADASTNTGKFYEISEANTKPSSSVKEVVFQSVERGRMPTIDRNKNYDTVTYVMLEEDIEKECGSFAYACASKLDNIIYMPNVGRVDSRQSRAWAHEYGHAQSKMVDEYDYEFWNNLNPNPISKDGMARFPLCCYDDYVCCEYDYHSDTNHVTNGHYWERKTVCSFLSLKPFSYFDRSKVVDDKFCEAYKKPKNPEGSSSWCGEMVYCFGMPYKNLRPSVTLDNGATAGLTGDPEDVVNEGIEGYSIMGIHAENVIYPKLASCPLRNC